MMNGSEDTRSEPRRQRILEQRRDPPKASMTPETIRTLRGTLSRAKFAKVLGVAQLTVYRWELPSTAREARRPRAAVAARLAELAHRKELPCADQEPEPTSSGFDGEAAANISDAIDRLLGPEWRTAEVELLARLYRADWPVPPATRTRAAVMVGLSHLLHRGDASAALGILLPLLATSDTLPGDLSSIVPAVGALAFSMSDSGIFDRAHVAQLASSAREHANADPSGIGEALASIALTTAAIVVDDPVPAAIAPILQGPGRELMRTFSTWDRERCAMNALNRGRSDEARGHLEWMEMDARRRGQCLLRVRALSWLALLDCDAGSTFEAISERVDLCQEICRRASIRPGIHVVIGARARAEAAITCGRTQVAEQALRDVLVFCETTNIPAIPALAPYLRLAVVDGRVDPVQKLRDRLSSCSITALRPQSLAYAALADGLLAALAAFDPEQGAAALTAATSAVAACEQAGSELNLYCAIAYIAAGQGRKAKAALDAAHRRERATRSAWFRGVLQRIEARIDRPMVGPQSSRFIELAREAFIACSATSISSARLGVASNGSGGASGPVAASVPQLRDAAEISIGGGGSGPVITGPPRVTCDVDEDDPFLDATPPPGFSISSPEMRRLIARVAVIARSKSTVVITGESGTGKDLVARALHHFSLRSERPLVAFNCCAVPHDLFEGQLFGHRRGAFTGAHADSRGVICEANHGTLFLDEIGELPLKLQPKLLRFLESGEISPLGESRPRHVDVRVVAATHRNLKKMVREGTFREDLYFRIDVVSVHIPPLRDRPSDIVPLALHFMQQLASNGVPPPVLSPDATALLLSRSWPGNVRELRNAIERAMALVPGTPVLTRQHLCRGDVAPDD
jgi:DNA-binding transcriptional regulator YiaG